MVKTFEPNVSRIRKPYMIMVRSNVFHRVWCFYRDGFRGMTIGRTLWALILLKLFIMFAVLKLFFFPNKLAGMTDEEKSDKVIENLTIPYVKTMPAGHVPFPGM